MKFSSRTAVRFWPVGVADARALPLDDVGVKGYRIYRNGTVLGTTTGTSVVHQYATSGTYAVAAHDAAGNASAASPGVTAR